MTATPAPTITAPLVDPSGPVPRHQPVTWFSCAVSIRRRTPVTSDERTIALPFLVPPDRWEIEHALEHLGWCGYHVMAWESTEVAS